MNRLGKSLVACCPLMLLWNMTREIGRRGTGLLARARSFHMMNGTCCPMAGKQWWVLIHESCDTHSFAGRRIRDGLEEQSYTSFLRKRRGCSES